MLCFPNAKINIGLNVIEKRLDGYHNIESVFYPIPLYDVLEVIENSGSADGIQFQSTGISIPGNISDNLCVRAYNLIAKDYVLPKVKVHLHKIIPIGAGLGGGSSNAAFFIKLLNEKFELGISWGEQHNYARQLGSDCSFFITNKPVVAEEKGDVYESIAINLDGYYIAVINPAIHINTTDAYTHLKPQKPVSSLENDLLKLPMIEWRSKIKNDFEVSVFERFPLIDKLKQQLYKMGAIYASMSGSGSSVYGLFEKETNIKDHFKDHYVFEKVLTTIKSFS